MGPRGIDFGLWAEMIARPLRPEVGMRIFRIWSAMETGRKRWRLKPAEFRGAGSYVLKCGDDSLTLEVDGDGVFETKLAPSIPLYPFASLIK